MSAHHSHIRVPPLPPLPDLTLTSNIMKIRIISPWSEIISILLQRREGAGEEETAWRGRLEEGYCILEERGERETERETEAEQETERVRGRERGRDKESVQIAKERTRVIETCSQRKREIRESEREIDRQIDR